MLVLLGSSHHSAPVEVRERLAFAADELTAALDAIRREPAIDEAMILSTCNRTEIVVRSRAGSAVALEALKRFVAEDRGVGRDEIDRHCYELVAEEAVRHLFEVACGLDSMILGEPQILGQIKQAYRAAHEHGACGPVLERLMQHCFATAKRVRTDTEIGRNAVSVAFAAVELAKRIFGSLDGRSVQLLGAGKMSDLLARHLVGAGVTELLVASRTYSRAAEAARRVGGRAVHWDDGLERLGDVDIVISATGATRPILDRSHVAAAMKRRRSRPLFLIDIAVPRDIEPDVQEIDNVYLYDIDALNEVVGQNRDARRQAAEAAAEMIEEDVRSFSHWRQSQEITPMIVELRESLLGVGRGEVERFRAKLGSLDERQAAAVEALTRAVIQKILHRPIRHLKGAVERGDVERTARLYREVFGLEPDAGAAKPEEPAAAAEAGTGPSRVLRGGKDDEEPWRRRG